MGMYSFLSLFSDNVVFSQPKVTAEKVGDRIEFKINGNLFTNYVFSPYEKYPFSFR